MTVPPWAWAGTVAIIAVLIAGDLVVARGTRGIGLRGAAVLSGLWIVAGLAFGGGLWLWQGSDIAGQYFGGYLLEKALSVDNVFVFVLLFTSLGVPIPLQRRVLYLGVVGALGLRGAFITAGGALIDHISWAFYAFGAVVLLAGLRMFRPGDPADPARNPVVRGLRRVLPVTDDFAGNRFLVRSGGRTMATPLLVALVAIEVTDLVFALDSIPAVFGVTRNLFIVFTSNAFAVLGLRALYFLLAGSMDRFSYLKQGLAVLLAFIGVKMLISSVVHVPLAVSLAVIVAVLGSAVAASIWRDRTRSHPPDQQGQPGQGGQEGQPGQEDQQGQPGQEDQQGHSDQQDSQHTGDPGDSENQENEQHEPYGRVRR
jgi:tellurite resistance protein TerC